ncbi:MAG: hypothetical protein U0931_17565 [Vulcanimicrobiota bacterium]
MKRLLFLMMLPALSLAQPLTPPRPYAGGDYWVRNENTWSEWEVVCAELSGHLSSAWPINDEEPGALLNLDWRMGGWPVVIKFPKGQRLKARPDSVGGSMWKDFDGNTWLRVQVADNQFCFVRANARFLKPVASAPPAALSAPPPAQEASPPVSEP